MTDFDAKSFLTTVPEDPGVYRMIGEGEVVLYVGKAKNLKRRVSSYFLRTQLSPRIALMVQKICRVDITVTRSEAEALILENNLIKELSPRYNILFRDDKSYPYIAVSGDAFPRISFHRGAFAKGTRYFGPFPNVWAVRETLHLLQKLFRLRTCENSVFQHRSRACLLHQIQRCTGPCVGLIADEDYARDVKTATLFLDGRTHEIVDDLSAQMMAAADALDFEQAALLRDRIRNLQAVLHKQFVETDKDQDVDILAVATQGGLVCVNLAMVRGGRHLGDRQHFPANAQGAEPLEILLAFLEQHYSQGTPPARILLNLVVTEVKAALAAGHDPDEGSVPRPPLPLVEPRFAAEKAWMEMAVKNAEIALLSRARELSRGAERERLLQEALGLAELPKRIECFDISHTQGEATMASCVVWEGGEMKRSEYRRYTITDITGGDDYAAMRQALQRRFGKVVSGEAVSPDVLLIDGGRGQVNVASEVLHELGLEQFMVGVAKGEGRKPGLESLIFPLEDGREAVHLAADSPALHLIQEVRDEAHRFAITGMRAKRGKARGKSKLEDIPGIGPTRRRHLLAAFGGLDGVLKATVEDLCRVEGINRALAESVYNALH